MFSHMFLGADGKKRSALFPKTIKRFFLSEPGGRVAEGSASNLTEHKTCWLQKNTQAIQLMLEPQKVSTPSKD